MFLFITGLCIIGSSMYNILEVKYSVGAPLEVKLATKIFSSDAITEYLHSNSQYF